MNESCAYFEDLILRLPDGELTDTEAAELQEHLRICPSCRRLFRAMDSLTQTLEETTEPPAELADGVMNRILSAKSAPASGRRKKSSARRFVPIAAAAGLIVIAAAVGIPKLAGRSAADTSAILEYSIESAADEAAPAAAEGARMSGSTTAAEPETYTEYEDAAAETNDSATLETRQVPAGRESDFEAIITDSHQSPDISTASWTVIAYVEYKGVVYEFLSDADGQSLLWRDAAEGVYPIVSPQTPDALLSLLSE